MPVIFPVSPSTSSEPGSSAAADNEGPGIWFDAIDHVELDDTWFDAEEHFSPECKEERVPLTEDCRRCVKQMIRYLGEVKEHELIHRGLARMLPGLPVDVLVTVRSLYGAVMEGRNLDLALLNTLGLASSTLLADGNLISSVANYLREAVIDYVDG